MKPASGRLLWRWDSPVRGAGYEPAPREQSREISNRREKQVAVPSWWQEHVYEVRAQQRYAFQIVKFETHIVDWSMDRSNNRYISTDTITINDHHLQTTSDIDCYIYQTFVSIRHSSSRFFSHIQHTEFFPRRLLSRMFDKCKRWRLRYYEYKNARWNKFSYEIHEMFTTYEKKKKIINTESNVVREARLRRVLRMMVLKGKSPNSMDSMNHCITEKHHYSHIAA